MDVIEPEELSCLKYQFVNLDELKEDVKMKMNVCWRRKDTQIETDPCVIQDVICLLYTSSLAAGRKTAGTARVFRWRSDIR